MYNLLKTARQRLIDGEYTCVLLLGDDEYTSHERGVKPLLTLLEENYPSRGAVAADKCIGAGAAHLYVLLGVKAVWANLISESAIEVLKDSGIEVDYEKCVPYIINRKGDGPCPIESAVKDASDSMQALSLIKSALKALAASAIISTT